MAGNDLSNAANNPSRFIPDDLFHRETAVSNRTMAQMYRIQIALNGMLSLVERHEWAPPGEVVISGFEKSSLITACHILSFDLAGILERHQKDELGGKGAVMGLVRRSTHG